MNMFITFLIKQLANALLGADTFNRILASVQRWADKEISGLEKKQNVLSELEIIGLKLTEQLANLGVELAVAFVRSKA